MSESPSTAGPRGAAALIDTIHEAIEPVAQFWPMKGFVHHNPIHGLEHLPFDEAVREGERLFGARGYLDNEEYRALYRDGRITSRSVDRALHRVGLDVVDDDPVHAGSRAIGAAEVRRLHLLCGLDALEPALFGWRLGDGGALERVREDIPEASTKSLPGAGEAGAYLTELWSLALGCLELRDPRLDEHDGSPATGPTKSEIDLPPHATVSDWVDRLAPTALVDAVNDQLIKWIAAFVDEGMAGWAMPARDLGFYAAWRRLAPHDASARFLGIADFARKVRELPSEPEDAIRSNLERLGVAEGRAGGYLGRSLAQLPGWTGFIRWRGNNPHYPAQKLHPIDPVQYLAVRLFYEAELAESECRRLFGVDASVGSLIAYWQERRDEYAAAMGRLSTAPGGGRPTAHDEGWRLFNLLQCLGLSLDQARTLGRADAERLLAWVDRFPAEDHGPVWLEAYEDSYRERVLQKLSDHAPEDGSASGERPRAQAVFCIDVRSEPFRRHLEAQGPYQTFGFAGFFGIPISHRVYDTDESVDLCPVLLSPNRAVFEMPRADQAEPLKRYAAGSRWRALGAHLFHDLKHNPIAAFMLIDVLGLFFSAGLVGKTLLRRPYRALMVAARRWFVSPVATAIPVDVVASEKDDDPFVTDLSRGFTIDEQATFIENGLRTMGLTSNFARFVVLCGHGGNSDNNPYFAALHCGACGGRSGDPNARVFAAMGNQPEVRRILRERGLDIPEDTWFLGGRHDTNTDRLTLYDLEDVPASHADDLRAFRRDAERGGAEQALERCHRIPGAPRNVSPEKAYAHVEARSFDWANPRPEWGLSGNAGFIIGRRSLTQDVDLEGRVFLNSYDPVPDPEGAILEKIMTAPLIVGEWISMEHYFSAADPWSYGSGSKVIHNVVSGVGLMLGSQSDLQTGLPLQTVNDGARHQHEPMRLLAIIEAKPDVIGAIIQKHDVLQQHFHNQWVNLVSLDPVTRELQRYNPDATWEPIELATAEDAP